MAVRWRHCPGAQLDLRDKVAFCRSRDFSGAAETARLLLDCRDLRLRGHDRFVSIRALRPAAHCREPSSPVHSAAGTHGLPGVQPDPECASRFPRRTLCRCRRARNRRREPRVGAFPRRPDGSSAARHRVRLRVAPVLVTRQPVAGVFCKRKARACRPRGRRATSAGQRAGSTRWNVEQAKRHRIRAKC